MRPCPALRIVEISRCCRKVSRVSTLSEILPALACKLRLRLLLKSAVARRLRPPSDKTSLSLWTRPVPKACIQSFSLSAPCPVLLSAQLNLITPEGREILDFLAFPPHIYAFLIICEKSATFVLEGNYFNSFLADKRSNFICLWKEDDFRCFAYGQEMRFTV